ncbi:LANO_0G16864g1_1 [Lachancea nothofagi CBS 11611]|uniref:LANO_0G16864g1_1 n=1 Tax=Lachancea nothofagi CBS 11611 TaxID=1266666 RepID=A0A1G4KKK5_9SACH|nr:LANO_0G16864g1_1 [Lachancea nothofagi CBS 11611]
MLAANIVNAQPFSTPQTTPVVEKRNPRPTSPAQEVVPTSTPTKQVTLVNHIATMLSALTFKFSNQRVNNNKLHLAAFLTEVFKRSKCSKKIILLSIYYFHKLYTCKLDSITSLPEFSRCSKRIYLCCIILAHKFLNDQTFSMSSWQRISGLSCRDISTMERWCLAKLNYELLISDEKLTAWSRKYLYNEVVVEIINSKKRIRETEILSTLTPNKRLNTNIVII